MVPDPQFCCYGLEYFCFDGDQLWNSPDAELIALAKKEIQQIGTGRRRRRGRRSRHSPAQSLPGVRRHLSDMCDHQFARRWKQHCPNLHLVGRNGMHKYNNQDHAMMTALLAARNILAGRAEYDVWAVNQDGEYHESGSAGEQRIEPRLVPLKAKPASIGVASMTVASHQPDPNNATRKPDDYSAA